MTTREENKKKINDELEQLDDEQLDDIAGGFRNSFTNAPTEYSASSSIIKHGTSEKLAKMKSLINLQNFGG